MLIAFVILGLVVVAACESTRGYLRRVTREEMALSGELPVDATSRTPGSVT